MKSRKMILLSSLVLASLALTACGGKDEVARPDSATKTSQTTLESKSATKTDTKKTTKTDTKSPEKDSKDKRKTSVDREEVVSEDKKGATEPTKAEEASVENPTEASSTPASTSQVDLEAIAAGDYSSLAGSWTNAEGVQMIFDGQNISTVGRDGQRHDGDYLSNLSIADGLLGGSIFNVDTQTGAVFIVIPAGTPSRHYGKVYDTDVICVGHSVDCELNPFVR